MVMSPPSTALGLNSFLRVIAYACSHWLTCQALGLSNRRQHSIDEARLALGITLCIGNLAWRVISLVRLNVRTCTYREVLAV
jgi:hypothetical protein